MLGRGQSETRRGVSNVFTASPTANPPLRGEKTRAAPATSQARTRRIQRQSAGLRLVHCVRSRPSVHAKRSSRVPTASQADCARHDPNQGLSEQPSQHRCAGTPGALQRISRRVRRTRHQCLSRVKIDIRIPDNTRRGSSLPVRDRRQVDRLRSNRRCPPLRCRHSKPQRYQRRPLRRQPAPRHRPQPRRALRTRPLPTTSPRPRAPRTTLRASGSPLPQAMPSAAESQPKRRHASRAAVRVPPRGSLQEQ